MLQLHRLRSQRTLPFEYQGRIYTFCRNAEERPRAYIYVRKTRNLETIKTRKIYILTTRGVYIYVLYATHADTKSKSEIYHQATKVNSQNIQNFSLVLLRLGKYRKCSFFTVTTYSMSGRVYILRKSVT